MISAIILTQNEALNISDCLKSLHWIKDIIVVDDYSTDKTVEIAESLGARVFIHKLEDNFSSQRNFGLQQVKGDWVLFIDADELVSLKLKQEIINVVKQNQFIGFYFKRKDYFLGKYLKYGETANVKLLRLAKKDSGFWKRPVHEVWQIKGNTALLKNPLIHYRNLSLSQFLSKIDYYSTLRAAELYKQKVKTNPLLIILYGLGKFKLNYCLRLGFLDGVPGFTMAVLMALHSIFTRIKLYYLWQKK